MRSLFGLTVVLFACTLSVVAGSNSEGEAFLKENAEKEGVVVLASGLQYKVLTKSTKKDARSPAANSPCKCHYRGSLVSGEEFDSSYKRGQPSTFAPNQARHPRCAPKFLS